VLPIKPSKACKNHPKRHTREKESEAVSETDGPCSSEHELRGIGFEESPIGYEVMQFS